MLKLNRAAKILVNRILWIAVFLLLSILFTNQYILYKKISLINVNDQPASLALRVSQLYNDTEKLREQLDSDTQHQIDLQNAASSTQDTQKILEAEQQKYEIILGQTSVQGPGVTISIGHYLGLTQLVDLVNELRNSGAEAVSINNTRVVTTTPMANFRDKPNYSIQVIGDKDVLYDSLTRPGGILDLITNGDVQKSDSISLLKV
jgi:uncharacterized protein YlxW (UPF0749 family)